jgi:hypothetical protein
VPRGTSRQIRALSRTPSKLTRYSIDFRTVHLDDVLALGGARNVDSACTGTTLGDYLRGTDFAHLPDEAIALYRNAPERDYIVSTSDAASASVQIRN